MAWPAWVHILVFCPVGLAIYAGIEAFRQRGWDWGLLPFAVVSSIGVVWWRFRYLFVTVDPTELTVGFGPLRRVIARARIQSVTIEEYPVSRYMGWGYRIGWKKGDRAYSIPGPGRGVRIEYDDENGDPWSIFVSSFEPEALAAALQP